MVWPWVPLRPLHYLIPIQPTTKKIGWNVAHPNIGHFTIEDTLMIHVFLKSPGHIKCFQSYLNSRHANISFTIENEKKNKMSFVDVIIIRKKIICLPQTNF